MKTVKRIILCSLLSLLVISCITGRQQALQVERHDIYAERIVRDSIFLHDSTSLVTRADTVFLEKVRTLYHERMRVDTVFRCDTLYRENNVVVEKKTYSPISLLFTMVLVFIAILSFMGVPQKLWNIWKKL